MAASAFCSPCDTFSSTQPPSRGTSAPRTAPGACEAAPLPRSHHRKRFVTASLNPWRKLSWRHRHAPADRKEGREELVQGAGGRAAPCEPWQPEAALTAPGLVPADCLMRPLRRAGQATTGPWERCTRLPPVVKLQAVQDSSKGILWGSRDLSACWCLERSGRMTRCSFRRPPGGWSTCPGLRPSSSWTLREGAQHTGKSHPGASGRKRGISRPLARRQALYKPQLI